MDFLLSSLYGLSLYSGLSSIALFVSAKFLFKVPRVNWGIGFLICTLSYVVFLLMCEDVLSSIVRTFSGRSLVFSIPIYALTADLTVALLGKIIWKCSWPQAFLSVIPMAFFHLLYWGYYIFFVGAR